MFNAPQLIKLTPHEADHVFPCTEDTMCTNPDKVEKKLVEGIINEVINNCGHAPLKEFKITKYYDSFNEKMKVDEHGDEYVEIADVTVFFEDGQQESFIFVCLM